MIYRVDREKCEKVAVRDNGGTWVERTMLTSLADGRAMCVYYQDEHLFKGGCNFDIQLWDQWKPLPKKQWRKCTNEELEIFKDCWFRSKSQHNYTARAISLNIKQGVLGIGLSRFTTNELFNKHEVFYNGEWQPVGILEGN